VEMWRGVEMGVGVFGSVREVSVVEGDERVAGLPCVFPNVSSFTLYGPYPPEPALPHLHPWPLSKLRLSSDHPTTGHSLLTLAQLQPPPIRNSLHSL
jgi:hypothetical protein